MTVSLRVIPNAAADRIEGPGADADGVPYLKIRVMAVPEKGKGNKAVIALLAKAWRVPKSSLEIVSGLTDRRKVIQVSSHVLGGVQETELLMKNWFDTL